ncbi:S-adenosyl-L-methionine-dependent methyltransferase [Choiromyces venosus 120613-1]|uniref:S-adenosyl-L-methionine-dependent methyltransferase n=1 Tax=Choiromyces venosus 120613-1 TaxID=1336337 RepID=A0A3N4JYS8_9PEZI|nr:S-adenosyl-L-methionine-dependent methyltransferase [Choiromyces venosus 120613-1]
MSSNLESDTISLDTSFEATIQIQGRMYQQWAVEHGTSFGPIDEYERDRQETQHEIFKLVFDGRLILPPIQNPRKILDCGYGSASWATEVAISYPQCEVIGVDITPHMVPDDPPLNLILQVDDLNEPFTFHTNEFDFIHSRNVVTGINKGRWPSYVKDCARVLKPGGWLQMVEIYHNVQSDNGTMTDEHALREASTKYLTAAESSKDLRAPLALDSLMRGAGMENVASKMIPMPLNGWSINPKEREIGEKFNHSYKAALAGHMRIPLTERLQMTHDQFDDLIQRATEELDNVSLKPYVGLYIAIGCKAN